MSTVNRDLNKELLMRRDLCDRCNAIALVFVTLKTGDGLQFCGHHARRFEASLRPQVAEWRDTRVREPAAAKS